MSEHYNQNEIRRWNKKLEEGGGIRGGERGETERRALNGMRLKFD